MTHISDTPLGAPASHTAGIRHLLAASIGRWVWPLATVEWIVAVVMPHAAMSQDAVYVLLLAFVVVNSALQLALQRALATLHALHRSRVPGITPSRSACSIALLAVLLAGPALVLLLRQPGASALVVSGIVVSWVTGSAALVLLQKKGWRSLFMPLLLMPLLNMSASLFSGTLAWSAGVLGAGLAAWCWRALLWQDLPANAYGFMVAATVLHGHSGPWRRTRTATFLADLERLCTPWRRLQQGWIGPYDMRAWLGRPFLPRPWWKHVLNWSWGMVLLAVLLVMAARSHWSAGASEMLVGVVTVGVLVIGVQGMRQLGDLFHRSRGAAAELALLPGLGDVHRQRATLYRYALRQPLLRGALAAALALLGGAWTGASAAVLALMAAWSLLALGLAQVVLQMNLHPTLAPARWMLTSWLRVLWLIAWLLAFAMMVVLSARWLGQAADAARTSAPIMLALLLLGALGAMARAIARHMRHARRLPHPFVQR